MCSALTYPEFKPSDGREPPCLAGRETEKQALRKPLNLLLKGEGADRNVIIIGPRGNGKTVLMRWFEDECKHGKNLDVVWLAPSDFGNKLDDLANELAPPTIWRRWLPDLIGVGLDRISVNMKWQVSRHPGSLADLLISRCRKRPLALLLDEAHTLDPGVGQILLNASQRVRARAPFLLVFGGTPGLQYRLSSMDASFWNRSDKLGVGLLDKTGARNALLIPFQEHGIDVDQTVMEKVIKESQRYPYFLQCWGATLTDVLRDKEEKTGRSRQIDTDILKQALPMFDKQRVAYYEPMREEIAGAGLQTLAAAVTKAYGKLDAVDEHKLDSAISSYLTVKPSDGLRPTEQEVVNMRRNLAEFGYVWRPPEAEAVWHAGIPSLMSHILKIEKKKP